MPVQNAEKFVTFAASVVRLFWKCYHLIIGATKPSSVTAREIKIMKWGTLFAVLWINRQYVEAGNFTFTNRFVRKLSWKL
jgi:hypothetical protein